MNTELAYRALAPILDECAPYFGGRVLKRCVQTNRSMPREGGMGNGGNQFTAAQWKRGHYLLLEDELSYSWAFISNGSDVSSVSS